MISERFKTWLIVLFALTILTLPTYSQGASAPLSKSEQLRLNYDNEGVLTHLDAGFSLGMAGLGLDVSTNITPYARVRMGFEWMPPVSVPMSFSIQSYSDGTINSGNFSKMQEYMMSLTGVEVDDKVDMRGKPTMMQFKFLVDFYPVPDLGLRVTAGFFAGRSRIARARNTMWEMPSLLAVNIYNKFYDYFMETDFMETPIYGDIYLDPFVVDEVRADLEANGYLGIHVGDFRDGTPYILHPDKEGMVSADMIVNAVRPYIGIGYTTPLRNKRVIFDTDLGMMMWGGSPKIVTHEGVNLTHDVVDIKGRVGSYVRFARNFKVYPMLTFRLSFRAL